MLVKRLSFFALMLFAVLSVAGCGGKSKSNTTGGNQNPTLTINAVTLPVGYVGSNYTSTTLTAAGGSGSGYTWSVSGGSSLPGGVALSAAGVLSGKPTADGSSTFSVTVTDSAKATATSQLSLTVKKGVSITTAAGLPDGFVGAAYSKTLAASGGTDTGYTWTVASGSALPDGLTLTSAGLVNGKPTTAGAASFSITVTDSAQNSATLQFSASIKAGLAVATPAALPKAFVGSFYQVQLTATGGSGTYTWSLAGAATAIRSNARRMTAAGLPNGLSLSADGWITGTPTSAATTTATVIVTDSASNSASMDMTLTISSGLTITTAASLPGGHPGDAYSQTFAAAGGSGSGYTWASETLPGGLWLSADGVLSGSLPVANTYSLDVTVTDSLQNTATATFTIKVTDELRFTTSAVLPVAYVGHEYSLAFRAKGGSGSGYHFSLTGGSTAPAGMAFTSFGSLSGRATTAGTFKFNVTVTDSVSHSAQADFDLAVNTVVTINTPALLPSGTVGEAYSQHINVTGGSGSGYLWTLTSGAPSLSAVGLSFANGVVSGTPTATGTATFAISVTDDSLTRDSRVFNLTVYPAGPGYSVSGQIILENACGVSSIPPITLTLDNNPAKTAISDNLGHYTFAGVPEGDHIIVPSIAGASSIFYPATMPITVNGGLINNLNFVATLAFKVSGTVSYAGPETGRIYIWVLNKNCGGNPLGTSIAAPGEFTIEGVPPGSYLLGAGIDSLGFGYQNDVDAAGEASSDVAVDDADVTGATITMTNPTQAALATGPTIEAITGSDNGVTIKFKAISGPHPIFNQIELATSYEIQWAESVGQAQPTGSKIFPAGGSNDSGVLILNDTKLVPGTTYYFRMRGSNQAGPGPWTNYSDPVQVASPSGNQILGTVTFETEPTGPLYVGFYDGQTGKIYTTRIQNPENPQGFSVKVPDGQQYFHFAFLDQNNNGMIDPGDVSNTRGADNIATFAITGDLQGQDLSLDTADATATVTTQHSRSTNEDNSVVENYSLNFQIREGNKLPVSVRLMSGPHILHPVDLGKCMDCGNNQFRYQVSTVVDLPAAGDNYGLLVNYSDGSSETLTASVTGVVNALTTDLAPFGTSDTSLTPTFTWTDPANAADYQYQFYLTDNHGNTIWQIPGNNSNSGGLASTVTSITWGTDPNDSNNHPTVPALTSGVTYTWHIQAVDADGNSSEQRTWYKP